MERDRIIKEVGLKSTYLFLTLVSIHNHFHSFIRLTLGYLFKHMTVFESQMVPYFPVRPSQILMDLSKEAEARSLVSGEKSTSLTRALWPVSLANGFLSSAGFHKNSVKSSEPDTRRSGVEPCGTTQR